MLMITSFAGVDYDKIVFLYRLERGKASGSYGLNVAALAGLDAAILRVAARKSQELKAKALGGQASGGLQGESVKWSEALSSFTRVLKLLEGAEDIDPQLLSDTVHSRLEPSSDEYIGD